MHPNQANLSAANGYFHRLQFFVHVLLRSLGSMAA